MQSIVVLTMLFGLVHGDTSERSAWPSVPNMRDIANLARNRVQRQQSQSDGPGDTIAAVVKELEKMLVNSKHEADTEKDLYAKYVCYCDSNEARLTQSIANGGKSKASRAATIEELTASNGVESSKSAKLTADTKANEDAQTAANGIRTKEKAAFDSKDADLKAAISQMNQALDTLVGQQGSDHSRKMAGFHSTALLTTQSRVQSALKGVEAYMSEEQHSLYMSLVQAPGGDYTAESGKVTGMIKSMKDTLQKDLATTQETETKAIAAHESLIANLEKSHQDMATLIKNSEDTLAANDLSLAHEKEKLKDESDTYTDEVKEKTQLVSACEAKATDYNKRVATRTKEDTAITQAVSILDSDEAFASFQKVGTTKVEQNTGFLQHQVRRFKGDIALLHMSKPSPYVESEDLRATLARLLERSAGHKGSAKLTHVMSQIQAKNPFDAVLADIDKMIKTVEAEAASDRKEALHCLAERRRIKSENDELDIEIGDLEEAIGKKNTELNKPVEGDLAVVTKYRTDLAANKQAQADQTQMRKEENVAYQQNIKNLGVADTMLTGAISVLTKFYGTITPGSFVQLHGGHKSAPETWSGDFAGQSDDAENGAITMLRNIKKATEAEEHEAHAEEAKAQALFEDAMKDLVKEYSDTKTGLETHLEQAQATTVEDKLALMKNSKALAAAKKSKQANEDYIASIKAGCDFICKQTGAYRFSLKRSAARKIEQDALEKAKQDLKDSDAYQKIMLEKKHEAYGKCKPQCIENEHQPACKACLAGVSLTGYCAGHKDECALANAKRSVANAQRRRRKSFFR